MEDKDVVSVPVIDGPKGDGEVEAKSEMLDKKVKDLMDKWLEKRNKDKEMVSQLKSRLEAAIKRVIDGFERRMTSTYRDKDIESRIKNYGQIIAEVKTIEEHFRQTTAQFRRLETTVFNK